MRSGGEPAKPNHADGEGGNQAADSGVCESPAERNAGRSGVIKTPPNATILHQLEEIWEELRTKTHLWIWNRARIGESLRGGFL